eukprot:gene37658-59380_t
MPANGLIAPLHTHTHTHTHTLAMAAWALHGGRSDARGGRDDP